MKEREFIELLKPSLNCSLPICTDEERITFLNDYYKQRKQYIKCSCGITILSKCLYRHISRGIHRKLLSNKMKDEIEAMQKQHEELNEICELKYELA